MPRRTFLGAMGALAACAGVRLPPPPKKLSILILGGTGFIGPHIVTAARARGHTMTLFNRGKTHAELFPDLEHLHGDRDGDLKALEGRKWDGVIDTSGFVPRIVRASAQLLAPNVGQYVFISTISVYPNRDVDQITEASPVETLPAGEEKSEDSKKFYGALKALCEKEAATAFGGRATAVRPGLIVGPRDPTDRFTYWPVRIDRGGEALAPGDGSDPVQFIDGRDLADFTVRVLEDKTTGTFNAVGPARTLRMKELLEACRKASANPASLVWVPADFLEKQEVSPWGDMPAWVPHQGQSRGFALVSAAPAIAKGLAFRPLDETIRDTLAYFKSHPDRTTAPLKAGIAPDREQAVIAAWRAAAK